MKKRKILLFALCLTLGCSMTACKRDRSEFEREDYMKNQEADKEQAAKLSGQDRSEDDTENTEDTTTESDATTEMQGGKCYDRDHNRVYNGIKYRNDD